jgi:hypothetical protein
MEHLVVSHRGMDKDRVVSRHLDRRLDREHPSGRERALSGLAPAHDGAGRSLGSELLQQCEVSFRTQPRRVLLRGGAHPVYKLADQHS